MSKDLWHHNKDGSVERPIPTIKEWERQRAAERVMKEAQDVDGAEDEGRNDNPECGHDMGTGVRRGRR
jgi:hypothetical protein